MVEIKLSDIPGDAVRASLCETIEKKLKSKHYNLKITSASKAGENNFIGIVYRISFNKEGSDQTSNLILKVAPQNAVQRIQFFARPAFLREIFMYETVLPYFREFEQSKSVENAFVEYPKCYRSTEDELQESLVLEDLTVRDLKVIEKGVEPTVDHVYLVLKTLAKYHAISFAIEDQQPIKFKELISKMDEVFLCPEDPFYRQLFETQSKALVEVLSDEKDAYLLEKVNKLLEKEPFDIAIDSVSPKFGGVITQGDAWQNNILFNYDSNGKPIEVSLLDWQLARHASPITDLVYFLLICIKKEMRDIHYDNFLKVYHETLSAHIRRLGSDPDQIFPYSKMLDHFRKFARYGLMIATLLIPILTTDIGNGIEMDNLKEDVFSGFDTENSVEKYHKRLRDVIIDMVRLEYI